MKKLYAFLILIIVFSLCLCSCSNTYYKNKFLEKRNINKFNSNISELGLANHILPDNFFDEFKALDSYFYYFLEEDYFTANNFEACDRLLLFFQYDKETYLLAKEFVFEHLKLSGEIVEIYNNYYFYDNITYANDSPHLVNNYPYAFVRFCYNDTNNTLIFIGFDSYGEFRQTADNLANDWESFLKEFYGEWYDFSA